MSDNLAASLLMLAAFVVFSAMAVFARMISDRIPVFQMVLVRQVVAFLLFAPVYWRLRGEIGRPRRLGLHLMRGVTAVGAMVCGLTSVILIPLADATAISMAEVLFATALAALVLGERVGWRRWAATAVGLAGVVVMLRPFSAGVDANGFYALGAAMFGAASMITVRLGSGHDRTETVMFWQGLVVLVIITPMALPVWVTPSGPEAAVLAGMSVIFTAGLWLITSAMRRGDASALAPLHYLRLILMAVIGWWLYDEVPSLPTLAGTLLILAAASYTLRRNALRGSAVRAPDGPTA